MLNDYAFNKVQIQAATLIKEGMRIALVHSITGVSWRMLREVWEEFHGQDKTPPGRLPNDTISYIKSGQSASALATVVSVYLSTENELKSPVDAFMAAWDATKLCHPSPDGIDINAGWYAVRDVKSGLISWVYCKRCKVGYLLDTKQTKKTDICPYCGEQKKLKQHEVAQ